MEQVLSMLGVGSAAKDTFFFAWLAWVITTYDTGLNSVALYHHHGPPSRPDLSFPDDFMSSWSIIGPNTSKPDPPSCTSAMFL
jgi:hypothetical protein